MTGIDVAELRDPDPPRPGTRERKAVQQRAAQLRQRVRVRRALAFAVPVAAVTVVLGALLAQDESETVSATRIDGAAPATTQPDSGLPDPIAPAEQIRVPLDRSNAPLAVDGDTVWVGTDTGIAAIDPVSLETLGNLDVALPVVALSTSPNGVWVLSGSNQSSFGGAADEQLPPYHVTLVDPNTRQAAYETDLPMRSSQRSNQNVRVSASQDGAWVGLGDTLVRVDPTIGDVIPHDLGGYVIGNLAADTSGLWVATAGGMTSETAGAQVLRVDRATGAVTAVPGIENGFMWSIAATENAAWLVETYVAPGDTEPSLHLVRIDAETLSATPFRVPAIAAVTNDDQVWILLIDENQQTLDVSGVVGKVDPDSGSILRTVDISVSDVPGSSHNGYNNAPFALSGEKLWSASEGLERTTP